MVCRAVIYEKGVAQSKAMAGAGLITIKRGDGLQDTFSGSPRFRRWRFLILKQWVCRGRGIGQSNPCLPVPSSTAIFWSRHGRSVGKVYSRFARAPQPSIFGFAST